MTQKPKWRLYQLGLNYPKTVLWVTFLLSIVSIFLSAKLKIETDPVALLPKHTTSVINLEQFQKYFGTNNYIMVALESDDPELAQKFADEFTAVVEPFPEVVYSDFRRPVEFFEARQWLYLDLSDLQEIEKRVDRTLEMEKKGISLAFNSYMTFADDVDKPDLSFDDIREKYSKKPWIPKKVEISADEGKFQVIRIKVDPKTSTYEKAKGFIERLRNEEFKIKTKTPAFNAVKVNYSGSLINLIDQTDYLKKEIGLVSIAVALALVLVVWLYFRNFESVVLIGLPLLASIALTGAGMYLLLGHLNMVTSFAAGIIAGIGSDYGVFLVNRYYTERAKGQSFEEACELAFANTGLATYGSMLTTVASFVALLFSDFGFFFEFGIAGALGIILNYVAMMLLMPSFLQLWHNHRKKKLNLEKFHNFFPVMDPKAKGHLYQLFLAKPKLVIAGTLALTIAACFVLPSQSKIIYAENLMENPNLPSRQLLKRIGSAIQNSLVPTILIAKNEEEEARAVKVLSDLLDKKSETPLAYKSVVGISTFKITQIEEKKLILKRLEEKISKVKYLPKNDKKKYLETLKKSITATNVTRDNLPQIVSRFFESPVDPKILSIYFYPSFGRDSNATLERYHNEVLALIQQQRLDVIPVDSNFAVDDILSLLVEEAPQAIILTCLFLWAIYWYLSRSFAQTAIVMSCLMGTLILLLGALWVIGIDLNILNIVALSIILGGGIDSFVHFVQHFDEQQDILIALKEKVPAIIVSNFTSIIGFGGLLLTSLPGLRSLGWVAIIGLVIVTIICIFVFPRCLVLEKHLQKNS